jgi:hypothetical protein
MRPTFLVLIALILAACNPNSGPASRSGNEAPRAEASTAAISESNFLSSMAVEGRIDTPGRAFAYAGPNTCNPVTCASALSCVISAAAPTRIAVAT